MVSKRKGGGGFDSTPLRSIAASGSVLIMNAFNIASFSMVKVWSFIEQTLHTWPTAGKGPSKSTLNGNARCHCRNN